MRYILSACSAALLLLLLGQRADAAGLKDRVPADALVYVGWAGSDHLGTAFEESHLKAVLEASQIPQLFRTFLDKAIAGLLPNQPEADHRGAIADISAL